MYLELDLWDGRYIFIYLAFFEIANIFSIISYRFVIGLKVIIFVFVFIIIVTFTFRLLSIFIIAFIFIIFVYFLDTSTVFPPFIYLFFTNVLLWIWDLQKV
jgi:hypothetical protein